MWLIAGLRSRCRSRVARSRRYLGGVGVIFLTTVGVGFLSDPGSPIESFLHHTPKLGIPVEMVKFLLKLTETGNSCCVPRFSLIASGYKIVDSQTSFELC